MPTGERKFAAAQPSQGENPTYHEAKEREREFEHSGVKTKRFDGLLIPQGVTAELYPTVIYPMVE